MITFVGVRVCEGELVGVIVTVGVEVTPWVVVGVTVIVFEGNRVGVKVALGVGESVVVGVRE